MKTFLTHKKIDDDLYEGPDIKASSFDDAVAKAKGINPELIVYGHMDDEDGTE